MAKKIETEELQEASFNMKKFFKTPEELASNSFADYQTKKLRKVLNKDLVNAPFLFVTNFKFDENKEGEGSPMIFIGDVNGFWKKAINQDYKRRKEFAQGVCTLVDENGTEKLVLDIQKGKGRRASNLKLLNKVLLKKLKITAEFIGKDEDTESEEEDNTQIKLSDDVVSQVTSVFGRIKQEVARFNKLPETDMEQRVRLISLIQTLINEWDITYKNHKSERKEEAAQISKLKGFLKEASKKYNKEALNLQIFDSFKEDLKSYLINRNDFVANAKTYKAENKTGEKLRELFMELNLLESSIADWKVINPKLTKEEEKGIYPIDSRVKIEIKDLQKWLKTAKINTVDIYQHKMDQKKEASAKQLARLANMTQLPEISKPSISSSGTFKKLYKSYTEYAVIPSEDIEMRKVKLLEITAYVNKWEEEWKTKNSLSKKVQKSEEQEVANIKKDLKSFLKVISEFTLKQDNYEDIMIAHREFQKLTLDYTPNEANDDKISYVIDNIDYMIEEWQSNYTNMSAFGTKKKNKKLEDIRKNLVDFVQLQGKNKQTDDTSNIITQLSKNKVEANQKQLEDLEKSETTKFYSNPENQKKLDSINQQRQELKNQEVELNKKSDGDTPQKKAVNLSALKGVKIQLNNLDNQQNTLEAPIKAVVEEERIKLEKAIKEDKKKLIQQIAVEVASQLTKGKTPEETSALAKHLAEELAKKHDLTTAQFQEIMLLLNDHTTYLSNNLTDEAKLLCEQTSKGIIKDPHFDLDDINAHIKTKLTYDYAKDNELKTIEKDAASIKKIKAKDKKERDEKLKAWYKKTGIWESKIGDYYPSVDLDKAANEISKLKNEIRPISEETKHTKELDELEKQIKVLTKNKEMLQSQIADFEKKLVSAKPEEKEGLIDKINQKKGAHIETVLKLKALSDEWEQHYDEISDDDFKKNKLERKAKIHTGMESFDKQLRQMNDQVKISEKHTLAVQIQQKYKNTNIQYVEGDSEQLAEAKKKNIKDILAEITKWQSISVVLLEEAEIKEQGEDAKNIKTIRDALLLEEYRFENKVTIYKDPAFDAIKNQVEKLKLDQIVQGNTVDAKQVNLNVIKQLYALEKIITTWTKTHPTSDANCIKQYEYINEVINKADKIKMSPLGIRSIEQQDFLIRIKDLEERYKEYSSNDSIKDNVKELADLKTILVEGIKDAKEIIYIPKAAHARLDRVVTKFSEFEKEMLLKIHEEKRKEEKKVLCLLEGCDSYDKVKNILSEEEQTVINEACKNAISRAKFIIEAGGSAAEAERMLEHIPITFWPDEFLEEMRLWHKAEELYFEQKGQEAEKEFIDSGLKQFIMDAKEAITEPMNIYNEVMKSGKYELEVTNSEGVKSKVEFSILDSSYKEDVDPNGTPMKGTTIAKNVLSTALDAKTVLSDIQNVIKAGKEDDPEAIRKRQVMIGRLVASTTQKICNNAAKYINTTAEGVNGPKIAVAVLKSVSLLSTLILKSTDGLEDPVLAKEHFKELFSPKNAGEIVSTLLDVGAGVSDIVSLFTSVGNVMGAAFGVAISIKDLVASAQRLHAAIQAKNEMRSVEERAVREDSIMLHAIRREMKTAKEDVAKEAINVTGDSLRVIGTTTSTVGAVVTLGHPAVGAGINVGGKIVEKLGDAIKIGGKVVFMIRDEATKKRVKKLIKEAKTDRNARIELLENSKFFAKAFLAAGLEDDDPIARHYCLVKGMTEEDLDHGPTARAILEKLIADDPTTTDMDTIGDKIQNFGGNVKKVFNKYTQLNTVGIKLNDVKELRPSVEEVISTFNTLGNISTGSTIATAILAGITGGIGALSFIGDDLLINYVDECAQHLKSLHGFLVVQSHHQDLNIKSLIERVDKLNLDIKNTDDSDVIIEKSEEISQREEEINTRKLYIQESLACQKLFQAIGIK